MTKSFLALLTGGVFVFTLPPALIPEPGMRQANTPPEVRITAPANDVAYTPGALVQYEVTVSDKEDGESKFEEIPPTELFMELRYFSDPAKAALFRKVAKPAPGYASFMKGDCYNCHAVRSKLIGPSFSEMAKKYTKPADVDSLAGHIRKGSTGIWGTAVMPTHPDLAQKDAAAIVRWILATGRDVSVDYFRGAAGAFRLQLPPKIPPKGFFLLKAIYADHGTDKNGAGSLTGQDVKLLKLSAAK